MEGITLTEDERIVLTNHFKKSPVALIRSKAMAVKMSSSGVGVSEIAVSFSVSERTVTRWLNDFRERRLSSLFSGKAGNTNAAKLTREQKETIRKLLGEKPSEHGLPAEFWDVPNLKDYLQGQFEVTFHSPRSYHFLLEFGRLSFKYPDTFDLHRDEEAAQKRMREVRKEIKQYKKDPAWVVAASDEVRVVLEALTRKAWLRKGERTVIKVNRRREHQNYIGFLDLKTKKAEVIELAWQNQEEIIGALVKFAGLHPGKRICLIWDNVSFHKGGKLREELKGGGRLEMYHLINFPPYSPDCNPIEKVWNHGKGKIANKQFQDFSATKEQFVSAVKNRTFRYAL